jgi:hypothetical protein
VSPSRRRAAVAALLALAAAAAAGCGAEPPPPAPRAGDAQAPFRPAPVRAETRPAPSGAPTARLVAATWLRAAPDGRRLKRLKTRTEFGSPRILSVVSERDGWLEVLAPELPNGRKGWVPAGRTRSGRTNVSLVIDRSRRELRLLRGTRTVRRAPIAVGRPGTPTPTGRFAVTDKLRTGSPDSPYGCCALALTGHQTKLRPGWPGGDRLAIHGTPQPETVGQAASLGCMRAHRRDIRALMRAVPLGAPVTIRA